MKRAKSLKMAMGLALLALASWIGPANAVSVDFSNPAFLSPTGQTSIPIGHAQFCETRRSECTMHVSVTEAVTLDENRWNELLLINAHFNQSVAAITDQDLYQTEEFWTYPNGYGDCEDYALIKRRALIERGWPASALLLTVVRETTGSGHAVLLVRTDRGDVILDNQVGLVKLWNETNYQFVKRQSQSNAGAWVSLDDTRSLEQIASL